MWYCSPSSIEGRSAPDAQPVRQIVHLALHGEVRLGHAETAERAAVGMVRKDGFRLRQRHRDLIRSASVVACAVGQNIHGAVRALVDHGLHVNAKQVSFLVRRQPVMEALQQMFQERQVTKQYLALVHGTPARSEGTLSGPIARDPDNPLRMAVIDGGRPALTGYRVLWSSPAQRDTCRGKVSLVVCSLFTGRTHQIRVHMAALGHPLVGDALYGAPESDELDGRVFLHSWKLAFTHPVTAAPLAFCLPLPEELKRYLKTNRPLPSPRLSLRWGFLHPRRCQKVFSSRAGQRERRG